MSSSAVDVEVRLKLKDGVGAELKASAQMAEQGAAKVATATERAARRSAEAVERSATRQRSSYEKTSQAREALGIRSEKTIQKEIENTRRAYAALGAAGFASAQEQERAYAAVQSRITRLTNEMGKLTAAQRKAADEAKRLAQIEAEQARGQRVLRTGAAGAVGVSAAGYTLKDPAKQAMSFDERLIGMANTAFSERNAAGRSMGKGQLEAAINRSIKNGGTRDQAAAALDTMIASGTVGTNDAIAMLPALMKASTASTADASELATIGIRAMKTFKINPEDIPNLMNMAMAAGQAGGFELKDMAKWLPQQMAMAGNLGISGKAGFAKLTAWNQASVITSGTKDEAGNNLRDLLMEVNTPHFRKQMAEQYVANGHKAKPGEKESRMRSVDEIYLDYQSRGIDKVSATIDMVEKVIGKDKKYQELQAKLRATGADDKDGRREIIEAMTAQVQGTDVGKIFHNQQSLMGFLGLMNNQGYVSNVLSKIRQNDVRSGGEIETSFSGYENSPAFKTRRAGQELDIAQKSAMDSLTPAIGKVAEAFSDLATKYPLLTGVTTLATTALAALAGAAGIAAISMGGKVPGAGAIGRYAGMLTGSKAGQSVLKFGKVGSVAGVGALVGGAALEKGFGEDSAITRYGSSMLNGAAIGATVGSIVPAIGTAIGALGGGMLGFLYEKLKPAEQKPLDVNANLQVGLAPGLVLQGQSMQASGGNVYMNTGNLMNGAP